MRVEVNGLALLEGTANDVNIEPHTTPRRRTDLNCRVVDDAALLHDARCDETHRLNYSAYRIWELCDGQQTCAAIAQRMADTWRTTADEAQPNVFGAIREMVKNKLVDVLH